MKFKIIKETDGTGIYYWTEPKGFFNILWYKYSLIADIVYLNTQNPYDVWFSKADAKQHIKRWNEGYYKKKYVRVEIK